MNNILIPSSLLIALPIVIVFGIAIVISNILALILTLTISLGLTLPLVFMLSSMAMKISPSPSPSPSSWLPSVPFSSFFVPNRELVVFVELYCRCIVNSIELVEIPLLHIKLPIPYNRLFSMPTFIKPTIPIIILETYLKKFQQEPVHQSFRCQSTQIWCGIMFGQMLRS